MTTTTGHDRATRQRLIDAGARLFAARGFSKVTVRDICKDARANVAAVNYHFGGKTGLYEEIVRSAIRTMQTTTEAIREAGERRPPEEQLEIFIRIFLTRVAKARDGWIHQLMLREFSDPTPALDLVIRHVVRPRLAYLKSVVATLLDRDPEDAVVEKCVMSVQSQCLTPLTDKVALRTKAHVMTDNEVEELASHIASFSLAGIREVARNRRVQRAGPALLTQPARRARQGSLRRRP